MEKEDLVSSARQLVVEYYNRNVGIDIDEQISVEDVCLERLYDEEDVFSVVLTIPNIDTSYYEVTCNKRTSEIRSNKIKN